MTRRKTRDVYHVLTNYGQGWEHEATENSWREAREQMKTYRANVPGINIKAVRRREPVDRPGWCRCCTNVVLPDLPVTTAIMCGAAEVLQ